LTIGQQSFVEVTSKSTVVIFDSRYILRLQYFSSIIFVDFYLS